MTKPLATILNLGIVGFILLLPWQTHYEFIPGINNFTTINIYGFDIVLVVLLIGFAVAWYRTATPVNWLLLILGLGVVVLTLFSAFWAEDRSVTFYYWLHLAGGLGLIAIVSHHRSTYSTIGWAIVTTGLLQTAVVVWQWCTQTVQAAKWLGLAEQLAWQSGPAVVVTAAGRWLRAYGTMPHPNSTAAWLVLALLAALWLWSHHPQLRQRRWLLLCTVLLSLGLVLTFSRAALLAWIIVLSIGWFITKINRLAIMLSAGTIVVLGIVLWPLVSSRLQPQLTYIEQLSITERTTQYQEAGKLFLRYWPTGTGIGQYTIVDTDKQTPQRQPLHNVPLLTIIELGVFGALVWYAFIGYAVYLSLTKTARAAEPGRWLSLGLTAYLGLSLFDHYFWTNFSLFFGFCLWLGLALKYAKISPKELA